MVNILAFESSCDETAVALLEIPDDINIQNINPHKLKFTHKLHSQIDIHSQYGGVVPELASRDHIRRIKPLCEEVLNSANKKISTIDYFAYTQGPGLAGALMVAGGFASALAYSLQKPIIPVHHLQGHILSPLLSDTPPQFPFIALLISGGHSQIYKVEITIDKNNQPTPEYTLYGESIDDAVGEAFDKSAKLMGLPYPGGQHLEELALTFCPNNSAEKNQSPRKLPRPMINSGDFNMSFSGLKTALWHWVRESTPADYPKIASEFQNAISEVLVRKSLAVCKAQKINRLAVCGGVAKNKFLFNFFQKSCEKENCQLFFTPFEYCTDNGVMIALAALYHINSAQKPTGEFKVYPQWAINS